MLTHKCCFDLSQFNAAKTTVRIEAPTINSRKITADIIVNTPMDKVWSILTDYNNLATHVPNLVQSKRVQVPGEPAKIRLFQEGAQRIIGFDFRASLMMDMSEQPFWEYDGILLRQRKLSFKLVESKMFQTFDGSWTVEVHSKRREYDTKMQKQIDKYKTKLTYEVFVRPRGPVPVIALEWRIKEDIPINLWAIKLASERLPYSDKESTADSDVVKAQSSQSLQSKGFRPDWASDETLGLYM